MFRTLRLLALPITATIACSRTAVVDSPPPAVDATPAVPAELLRPMSLYDIRAEVMPLDEYAELPDALGLPLLAAQPLPPGAREIRIYTGLVIGYPHSGLVVREEAARVSGTLVRYWPVNDTIVYRGHDLESRYAAHEAGRCEAPRRGTRAVACAVRFVREPDWRALLATIDSAGAWTLPDEREVPRRGWIIDGWRMRVEARRDTAYHSYGYHNPQIYRPPEGPAALKLMWIVDSLFRFSMPPRELRHVRGIYLYGPDTNDFAPCDDPARAGHVRGNLGPIAALVGDSAWKARPAATLAFEIEAWARERADSSRRGPRTYAKSWGIDSVMSVRPAPNRRCSNQVGGGPR